MNLFLLIRLFRQFSRKRKSQLLALLILMILSGLFQILSLIAVGPFLSAITNPQKLWNIEFIKNLAISIGIDSSESLLIPIAISFSLFALIAATFRSLNLWANCQVSRAIGTDLSCKAYKLTLDQPYEVHVKRNSSTVIATLTQDLNVVVGIIVEILQFITSLIITIFIIISLLYINASITISMCLSFCILYLLIGFKVQKTLNRNSKITSDGFNYEVKNIQEGIGSIRDIILDRSFHLYLENYRKTNHLRRSKQAQNLFIALIPRYSIEGISLLILAFISVILSKTTSDPLLIIPLLGTIALGFQRLIPVVQSLFNTWSQIRGGITSIHKVLELLEQSENKYYNKLISNKIQFKKDFKLKDISFRYEFNSPIILNNINLSIKKGEKIGLIGVTGSGKSTLVDLMMGLLKPTAGKLLVDNIDLYDNKLDNLIPAWRAKIAHVPQNIYLADTSIAENIAIGVKKQNIDLNRLKDAAQKAQISNYIDSLPLKYMSTIGEQGIRLSGGQRQRIGIARALYKKCNILFLDEATSALDSKTEDSILQSLKSLPTDLTVVLIAHRLSTLKDCNTVYKFEDRKLVKVDI